MVNGNELIRIFSGELDGQRLVMTTLADCIVVQIEDQDGVHSYGYHGATNSFFYDRMPALPHHIELFQTTAQKVLVEVENERFEVLTLAETVT